MITSADLVQADQIIDRLQSQISMLKTENMKLDPTQSESEQDTAKTEDSCRSAAVAALGINHAFIGCYTNAQGHIKGDQLGGGVYSFAINVDGSLTQCGEPAPSEDPSFVCVSDGAKYLYVLPKLAVEVEKQMYM